jgi:hypothetical protein
MAEVVQTAERRKLNIGLAQMLCGGVIMDVTNVEQSKMLAPRPSWPWKRFRRISVRKAASPA